MKTIKTILLAILTAELVIITGIVLGSMIYLGGI